MSVATSDTEHIATTANTANSGDEFTHVDPGTVVIGANVRTDTRADAKDFAASIRSRGVLEAITAFRDDEQRLVVLRGQRRAVVATKVGTPTGTVPVRVVPSPEIADRSSTRSVRTCTGRTCTRRSCATALSSWPWSGSPRPR